MVASTTDSCFLSLLRHPLCLLPVFCMFFLIVEVLVTALACIFLLYALLELRSVRKSRKQSLLHFQTMNAPSDGSTPSAYSD